MAGRSKGVGKQQAGLKCQKYPYWHLKSHSGDLNNRRGPLYYGLMSHYGFDLTAIGRFCAAKRGWLCWRKKDLTQRQETNKTKWLTEKRNPILNQCKDVPIFPRASTFVVLAVTETKTIHNDRTPPHGSGLWLSHKGCRPCSATHHCSYLLISLKRKMLLNATDHYCP